MPAPSDAREGQEARGFILQLRIYYLKNCTMLINPSQSASNAKHYVVEDPEAPARTDLLCWLISNPFSDLIDSYHNQSWSR